MKNFDNNTASRQLFIRHIGKRQRIGNGALWWGIGCIAFVALSILSAVMG